ncbi:MAG: hypothetical protein M1838_002690 [Thelocarpon superellum]|nr:MAG: hypothetical protein M1838_002690 [Thelocarpon superellum]
MADSAGDACDAVPQSGSRRVWTTLITNIDYLPGLLTLDHSLKAFDSQYPLVALYTDTFPAEGHRALDRRGIPKQHVKYLLPSVSKDFSNDPRFYDCWSKLTPFSLTQYDRVVQLDSDMLVMDNMDELMELHLDPPSMRGTGDRVFAAGHACLCNPLKKPHYPEDWTPANCAFTSQHDDPDRAQKEGPSIAAGLGIMNGGLQVVNPSSEVYDLILEQLNKPEAIEKYEFADQSLLSDLFKNRWVSLPYTYNALKTLRWQDVHHQIWRDDEIKNIHYILAPKPWAEDRAESQEETHHWWHRANDLRLADEKANGQLDGF